jgi:hypothetical protein
LNKALLNNEYQEYINSHLNSDIQGLVLNPNIDTHFDFKDIINQIESKKKSKTKLPIWFNTSGIYFPNKLNIEQTSSEITAKYKSHLVSGDLLIDITGGFGIDAYFFSKVINRVIHCEVSESLSEIVCHNYSKLNVTNIQTVAADGLEFLKENHLKYDWIYIDPSRRHDLKGKVFYLKDCLPNVPEHLDLLFEKCDNLLIKTSPLLDLSAGQNELKHIKAIHIVAVENEVKELLWVLQKNYIQSIEIHTVNLTNSRNEHFNFVLDQEEQTTANQSLPLKYLYEPNSAIMKSGAFNLVSDKFKLFKLHTHSHLYTSNELMDFPGRTFVIKNQQLYNKATLRGLKKFKANITTRNFPVSVADIRNKFSIKDGGDLYLFFTTNMNDERIVIFCEKNDN